MLSRAMAEADPPLPIRRRIVNSRLIILLKILRIGAELAYRRRIGLAELDRRLVSLIGNYEQLTSIELIGLTGQDKAQISRGLKRLTESGLAVRPGLRAPISLSPAGRRLFADLLEVSEARHRALLNGIEADAVAEFTAVTAALTERAALLLAREKTITEQERDSAGDETGDAADEDAIEAAPLPPIAQGADSHRPLSRLLVPQLITLVAYLQRSAAVTYKRLTGLSNFDWQVLSQIAEHQPLTLASLIAMIARDKSQIGRTVKRLEASGIIERRKIRRRRDIMLTTTAAGSAIYDVLAAEAVRRDAFLFEDIAVEARSHYLEMIDILTANATALVEEERRIDAA